MLYAHKMLSKHKPKLMFEDMPKQMPECAHEYMHAVLLSKCVYFTPVGVFHAPLKSPFLRSLV